MVSKNSFQIIWDVEALKNFKDILKYLRKANIQAPNIVKEAVISRLNLIKTNPFICENDKLKLKNIDEFKAFVVYSYRVTYQVKTNLKQIRVLRIRHTSREPLGY